MNTIQVFERNVYGRQSIYPTGIDGPIVAALTGRRTLTMADLRNLQHLGHEIEFVPDPESAMARYTKHALAI